MKLYGIPNCNTVKKSRDWLKLHDIEVEFHDFKKLGLDTDTAENWMKQTDWTKIVNLSGMTWRKLPEERKQLVTDSPTALVLMQEKTSVIKRPILEKNGKILHIGFNDSAYSNIFNLIS